MSEILFIIGNSDSGKDWIAENRFANYKLLKCNAAFKREFEIDHSLEIGACDNKAQRENLLDSGPMCSKTLSEAMVISYEQSIALTGYGAKFATVTIMSVMREVIKAAETQSCVCITDVRKATELKMLITLAEIIGYETRLVRVISNRSTKKASDASLESNIALYKTLTNKNSETCVNNY